MITGVNNLNYRSYRKTFKNGSHNGAYYYARELEKNIVPFVKTDRDWDLLGMQFTNHRPRSIIFIHHNVRHDITYKWLEKVKDPILVCSSKATYNWALSRGYTAIFLPLSVDVAYVEHFKTEKTKEACYAGNRWAFKVPDIAKYVPAGVDFPPDNLPREELLKFIAPYKICYAIGRCAIEARVLGCKIKKCDSRYPDPRIWKVLDNKDAVPILQKELDKIDGV